MELIKLKVMQLVCLKLNLFYFSKYEALELAVTSCMGILYRMDPLLLKTKNIFEKLGYLYSQAN